MLLVDAGGVFGTGSVQDKFKAQTALAAMNIIGYDALNLGDREMLYGLNFLNEETRQIHFPLLSANLLNSGDQLLYKPYVIKDLSGVRVAVLGLTTGPMQSKGNTQGTKTTPPADTVKKYVEELGSKVDVIILLADAGYQGAQDLARQLKGVDVIVASRDGQYIHSPSKVNGITILQSGNQGRYVGQLKIYLDAAKKIAKTEGNLFILDDKVADEPAMRTFIDRRQQEAEKLFGPAAAVPAPPARPKPATTAKDAKKPGVPGAAPGEKTTPAEMLKYVSYNACFRCHQEHIIKWQKTLHAKAYGALKVKSQWDNPACVKCHTTGFGHTSGFISRETSSQYMNVQCESCHGPGSWHVQNPQKGYGPVAEATCRGCHNKENHPGFNYQEALKRGVH